MRRTACLLVCAAALAAAAPSALAQSSPFDPIPQSAQPTATPTPEDTGGTSVLGQDVGRTTLYAIAGAIAFAFVGIGWWIARDARRSLPERHRPDAPPEHLTAAERRKRERNRARARQKTRAQRAARKTQRKR